MSEQTEAHSDARDLGTWRIITSICVPTTKSMATRKVERAPFQPVCHSPVLKISPGHISKLFE